METAAAFAQAGFTAHDVHMTDLLGGRRRLAEFNGLVACGGFSYGDVLGAGEGWAKSILFHDALREQFVRFFARADSFALGICNGCQMFAALKSLIPGSEALAALRAEPQRAVRGALLTGGSAALATRCCSRAWPARCCRSRWRTARGARSSTRPRSPPSAAASGLVGLRYVSPDRSVATRYPANPSGTPEGIAALTNRDGRVTIIMPHPERSFRYAAELLATGRAPSAYSGWMRLFRNARRFVG